jgi:hypothetical protein
VMSARPAGATTLISGGPVSRDASPLFAFWVLHLMNVLIILREISELLVRIELKGYRSFGTGAIAGWHWLPWDYRKELGPALVTWSTSSVAKEAETWVHWYLGMDFILAASIAFLFHKAIKRLQAKAWLKNDKSILYLPWAYGLANCVEIICTWSLVSHRIATLQDLPTALATATAIITDLKWTLLALCMISIIVGLFRGARTAEKYWWTDAAGKIAAVRFPAIAVLFLAFILAAPGGGILDQLPDILRAQTEHGSRWTLLGSSLALLFLAIAVRLSCQLSAYEYNRPSRVGSATTLRWRQPTSAILAIVLIYAFKRSIKPEWPFQMSNGALALPIVLLTGWTAAFILGRLQMPSPPAAQKFALDRIFGVKPSAATIKSIGRTLAAVVVASGGLGLVRAFVGPTLTAPLTHQPIKPELYWLIIGILITYSAPVLIILLSPAYNIRSIKKSLRGGTYNGDLTTTKKSKPQQSHGNDRALDTPFNTPNQKLPAPKRTMRQLTTLGWSIVAACLAAAAVFAWRPEYAEALGPEGVILFVLGTGVILLSLVNASKLSTPSGTVSARLGFSTRPILSTILITLLLAGSLDDLVRYHAARLVPGASPSQITAHGDLPSLGNVVTEWERQLTACLVAHKLPAKTLPMVLVAAPGGGIRAAFWTGLALDRMSEQPCGREQIFLASGVSGGSLGLAVWAAYPGAAAKSVASLSKPGPLAQAITVMLLRDTPRWFLGIHPPWRDRAATLEDAWASANAEGRLSQNWESVRSFANWTPHLILNATDMERGCRVLVTTLPRSITVPMAGHRTENPADCTVLPQTSTFGARMQFAIGSLDARDFVGQEPCEGPQIIGGSRRISTAALLSARFPYVSPTGGLVACPPPVDHGTGKASPTRVFGGDGGYRDGTGLTTLLDFWDLLAPELARTNASTSQLIVPAFVLLDNHYRSSAARKALGKSAELLAPLRGRGARDQPTSQAMLEQRTAWIAADELPGFPGPYPFTRWRVIAPHDSPEPAAPLGWVLSTSSQQRLTHQLNRDDSLYLLQDSLHSIRSWQRPSP